MSSTDHQELSKDMPAFESHLVEQIPRLRRYARALLGPLGGADDLVQDCLERAWSRAHQWHAGSNLRAWLFSIMHNLYVDQVRRHQRHPPPLSLEDRDPAAGGVSQEQRQMLSELDQGLALLTPEQREVLLMAALEGLSYEEIASSLAIPLGTVMSRLYRARERLRLWMEGEPASKLRRVK